MNNKEFTSELAKRLGKSAKDTAQLLDTTILTMKEEFVRGNSVSFQGFGVFEVKKKEERIAINPATQKRMVVPPKLVLNFKASSTLKEKMNNEK
ncbi:MAG: HU family DNA-binding protein [Prevotellaceae bacterium]|jgi:DNA-binding protein HU-beta|nr:HU family DNA-binding protein [Prevotellaceae bacterium]